MLIGLTGDVVVDRENPPEVFSEVADLLRVPDLLFGNLECPYSDHPQPALTANIAVVPRTHNLEVFAGAGFDVMSMANNHIVDAGHAAMLETRARLAEQGVAACGVGRDLEDARRPARLVHEDTRVGFLAYASVFPHGYEAKANMPGLAPLRAYNHFHEFPNFHAPGHLPYRIETIPDHDDHRNLEADIARLRSEVDVVAVSFHWGDYLRPFVLTDHEKRTARLCIDRGADLVIGHHHHALRGIEWYRGRPIFYGLGHFVFDLRLTLSDEQWTQLLHANKDGYAVCPREGWPLLPLHPDTRMTMLGWVRVEAGVFDIGFVPCRLRPDGRVVAVDPREAEGREVVEYLTRCNESEGLNGKIVLAEAPFGRHMGLRVVPIEQG
jgi:poly-gamma-glutamate capsule biosynthesis protein CapA/YwtB (metallophosphatase superfamily)